jgi:hypothetical protein
MASRSVSHRAVGEDLSISPALRIILKLRPREWVLVAVVGRTAGRFDVVSMRTWQVADLFALRRHSDAVSRKPRFEPVDRNSWGLRSEQLLSAFIVAFSNTKSSLSGVW